MGRFGVLAQLVERDDGIVEVIGSIPLYSIYNIFEVHMALLQNLSDPGVDAIFGIQDEYRKDKRTCKVNLTVGVYIDEDRQPPAVMRAIKEAERRLTDAEKTKSYIGIAGDDQYLALTQDIVLGDIDSSNIVRIQTVGGTSALRSGFEFLRKNGYSNVSLSNPTWANHKQIVGNLDYTVHTYPYMDTIKNFDLLVEHLKGLPEKTVCLFQARCHNPTGVDFTKDQWRQISLLCKENNLFPFFDSAYQGFADSLEEDNWSMRHFLEEGHEMFVAHSYSKSFALYNDRIGALFVRVKDKTLAQIVKRHIMKIIRVSYSNPPAHGSQSIKTILNDGELYKVWVEELQAQRERINDIRLRFSDKMKPYFEKDVINQIAKGRGFFCMLPLNREQIDRLKGEFGVYMTYSGRISLPGLAKDCIDYVVESIATVKG